MALNALDSAGKKRKRVGRGGARGGTSGKGHKGQKARSGPQIGIGFEGGQMPLTRRLPKRGFNNARFATVYEVVNLKTIGDVFSDGATVDKAAPVERGILKKMDTRLKILGDGTLAKKLIVHADAFSKSAQEGITNAGGQVHVAKEE